MTDTDLLLIGGGGLLAVVILVVMLLPDDTETRRRLERVSGREDSTSRATRQRQRAQVASIRAQRSDTSIPGFARLLQLLPNPELLRQRLIQTGTRMTLGEYVLLTAVAMLAAGLAIVTMLKQPLLIGVLGGIGAGIFLPHQVVQFLIARRTKEFLAFFPEAIDTMVRGLRSGLPVSECVATVGREIPGPIGQEFQRITDAVRLGSALELAMWESARRMQVPEFRFLVIAMAIQRDTGGNLSETLGNLADLLRRRRQFKLKIKALSSEAKASAMIIGSLPFLMFGVLYLMNPDYVMMLVHDERGRMLAAFALGMISAGAFVMHRITQFEA